MGFLKIQEDIYTIFANLCLPEVGRRLRKDVVQVTNYSDLGFEAKKGIITGNWKFRREYLLQLHTMVND